MYELSKGDLKEFNKRTRHGCTHACINSHYLEFVEYVNTIKIMFQEIKEFKVEIKNQTSVDTVGLYPLNRFLEYSVLDKNEDDLYVKSLFEDILSNSNLSVIKSSKNGKI